MLKRYFFIYNDKSFNDTLTNDIVSFEQLGPERFCYIFQREKTFTDKLASLVYENFQKWGNS